MKLNSLPPDEYYRQLAKVPTSGGAIFRNTKGEFLVVKPSYKNHYSIPGGMSEENESPRSAVIREVKEETGIDIKNPRMFCMDFASSEPYTRILFLFDCGILSEEDIENIKIDMEEIIEYRFVSHNALKDFLGEKLQNRLANSIDALNSKKCIYLEDGNKIINREISEDKNNYAFIDSQNVNLAIRDLGWKLNFQRFRKYLLDKYKVSKAFIFIGYLESNKDLYLNLERAGFICIFKPTLEYKDGKTKGNCDSELVLQTVIESENYNKAILVTGDGDFNCLARYLIKNNKLGALLIPNKFKFSALLKFKEFRPFLRYMNDLEKKLAYTRHTKEKTP